MCILTQSVFTIFIQTAFHRSLDGQMFLFLFYWCAQTEHIFICCEKKQSEKKIKERNCASEYVCVFMVVSFFIYLEMRNNSLRLQMVERKLGLTPFTQFTFHFVFQSIYLFGFYILWKCTLLLALYFQWQSSLMVFNYFLYI